MMMVFRNNVQVVPEGLKHDKLSVGTSQINLFLNCIKLHTTNV